MKILIAPNSFKECADSITVAKLLKRKLRKYSNLNLETFPLSDGGDGFLSVCREKYNLKIIHYKIPNLLNSAYKYVPVGYSEKEGLLYLEAADVIGIKDVPLKNRNPLNYNTSPLGILLKKISWYFNKNSIRLKKIIIGIGGTGTTDLGLGAGSVFGLKLLDKNDKPLKVVPKNFINTRRIIRPLQYDIDMELVTDVQIKILGQYGTTHFFAKQKGVKEEELDGLEEGVENIINILKRCYGADYSELSLGAGGGLGLGLSLLTNPVIIESPKFINRTLMLKEKVGISDMIITGEGSFDNQSLFNKATGVVIKEAIRQKKKIVLIAGKADQAVIQKLGYNISIIDLSKHFASEEESILKFKCGLDMAATAITKSINSHNDFNSAA